MSYRRVRNYLTTTSNADESPVTATATPESLPLTLLVNSLTENPSLDWLAVIN